jgi:Na+-translocating ferredoxin:NAD+ oxidoreductase RnfG subunit
MKTRILVSLVAALFAIGFSGLPISYAKAEFEWGDTAALKEHLDNHVKFPATGKVIKESCKQEMPDEFAKEQRAYMDSKLKDDTTYKNPGEVLAGLNLK